MQKKINDVFPNLLIGEGLFEFLPQPYPWEDVFTPDELNLGYFEHSSNKYVSLFVEKLLNNGDIDISDKTIIGKVISSRFYESWRRLFEVTKTKYNALENLDLVITHNYDREQHENGSIDRTDSVDEKTTGSDKLSLSKTVTATSEDSESIDETRETNNEKTGSDTVEKSVTKTDSESGTTKTTETENITTNNKESGTTTNNKNTNVDETNKIYPYNETAPVDSEKVVTETTDSETVNHGKIVDNVEDKEADVTVNHGKILTENIEDNTTTTYNNKNVEDFSNSIDKSITSNKNESFVEDADNTKTETVDRTGNLTETNNKTNTIKDVHENTKKGKDGDIPYQELLKKELEVWKWSFVEIVYTNVDSILASKIY